MAILETHDLTKVYPTADGPFKAVDQLNLSVNQGEIFGYLGPNGAGKTTTIRMLLDLIRPTAGRASLLGMDAQADSLAIKRRIGFLPAELALWKSQKSIEVVKYVGRIRGGVDMHYVYELAERLQFDLQKRVKAYSTGNKRKLGLILAMMNKPDLLMLDEPTSGLDPLMQQTFNQMMLEVKNEGRTVFLSSHMLSEVQAICERVGVLRSGRLVAVERVDALTHASFKWVKVRFDQIHNIGVSLQRVPGVSDVSTDEDGRVSLRLTGDFDPLLRAMSDHYVVDLDVEDPSLEEIFLAYYDNQVAAPSATNTHAMKELA